MLLKTAFSVSALALLLAGPVWAQDTSGHGNMNMDMKNMQNMDMNDMDMDMGAPKGDTGPSSQAFAKANAKMHEDMDIEFSGNADVDFARSMIAHHQGAIDMAKVELEHGKDPEIRKLAEGVIAAQEAEIKTMQDWLKAKGK